MTIFEIYKIFRQVAIDSGVINAFFVMDKASDINSNSFGHNKQDEVQGTYWTRQGVTTDNNAGMYPVLILEWKTTNWPGLKQTECSPLAITVAQQYNCPTCKKTWAEIDAENLALLKAVLIRAIEYKQYQIGEDLYWIHPSAVPEGAIDKGCNMQRFFKYIDLEIISSGFGVDGLRSKSTEIEFCFCAEPIEFTPTDWVSIGAAIKCQSCR